jgi:hypothetical protein
MWPNRNVVGGSVTGRLHVDLGAQAQVRCAAGTIEIEHDALPLAEHSEDRSVERVDRQFVVREVGVAHDHADRGGRIVGLDDALHVRC